MRQPPLKPSGVGVLLLDVQGRLVHYNDEAAFILGYPEKLPKVPSLDAILPVTRSQFGTRSTPRCASAFEFTSGRRQYVCRAFILQFNGRSDGRVQPNTLILLDRVLARPVNMAQWSEEFHLTGRESEAVSLLLKGLTSREIAAKMSISASTVKSFLKSVMVKVGASNRTAIIAKILDRAGSTSG